MPDRTPNQTTPDHDRTTIAEAAKRLGVSTDAVRKRLNRGQLHGEKVAGVWVVFLPAETSQSGHGASTNWTADQTGPDDRDRLIAALESDIDFLRRELDTRNDELERRDVLLREALGRIPALSAGEKRVDPQEDPPERHHAMEAPKMSQDTSNSRVRSWWRRFLGVSV